MGAVAYATSVGWIQVAGFVMVLVGSVPVPLAMLKRPVRRRAVEVPTGAGTNLSPSECAALAIERPADSLASRLQGTTRSVKADSSWSRAYVSLRIRPADVSPHESCQRFEDEYRFCLARTRHGRRRSRTPAPLRVRRMRCRARAVPRVWCRTCGCSLGDPSSYALGRRDCCS
jgi:hypothetical protein